MRDPSKEEHILLLSDNEVKVLVAHLRSLRVSDIDPEIQLFKVFKKAESIQRHINELNMNTGLPPEGDAE